MLTTKVISPAQGKSYYAQENSYSAAQSVANSQWLGKGAVKLELTGQVKSADFENLLYGKLPDGTEFRHRKNERKGYKERAGLDCTFSAPKSVSILALVAGRKEIEKAHKEAVRETLEIIEKEYATTRATKDGKVQKINTDNLVVGQFHHDTSRELDPHLHTHCVILNLTEHNNKWYSFRNDEIFANRKLLGGIYRNQLALKVKELGYSVETKEDGLFEIKGFTLEQLQDLSKRRQQILSKLQENTAWKEEEKIWDQTRNPKAKPVPRKELRQIWREELGDINYPKPSRNSNKETDLQKTEQRAKELNQAINDGINHCAERSVAFKPEAVQKFVLSEVGKYDYQEVRQAIASNNELIYLDEQVTTQTALLRELATIKLMKEEQNKFQPITTSETEIASSIAGLTKGQKNAVTLAATNSDRFIAWQGKAGVGKTYALNQFKQLAQAQGLTVKAFAPSAKAAQVLSEEMEIETTTVARKLFSQSRNSEQQQIWIVDEAGLLGAKTALALLEQAKEENARVLLVGDTKQLSSVEAGNPFKSLQQAGMATAHLNQSLRQKTADLKEAVDLISEGSTTKGIGILEKHQRLTELPELETRASQIAQDYLNLSRSERDQTLVTAGTHQERQLITDHIRQGLKQEGNLGEEVEATKLKSKNLTSVQKQYAHHYETGDVVIPFAHYKRLGLEKNQQYQVAAIEKDAVILVGSDTIAKKVDPKWFKHKDVYQAEPTQIAVGDRLRWGKNDKQMNRVNGAEFLVTSIDGMTATIKTAEGKEENINLEIAQHLDHALVSTVYSSQGATADRVLASLSNNLTTNAESFYVAASRAKYDLHLYVEDRAELLEKANSSKAQANPLELISQYSATTTQTENINYERNTATQSNSERDYADQSQPSRETPRKPRIKPARVVELAEHINRFNDEQEAESLEGNFRKLKRHLDQRIATTGRTAKLRNSIKQLDRTLTEYSHQRQRGERLGKLGKIQNFIEESIIADDPKFIEALRKLDLTLNNQPNKLNNLKKLQSTINQFERHQQQSQVKNQVEKLSTSIADIQEQKELEALTPSLSRLNIQLKNYSSDKFSQIVKKLQKSIDEKQHQQEAQFSEKLSKEQISPNISKIWQKSEIQQYISPESTKLGVKREKTNALSKIEKINQRYLKLKQKFSLDASSESPEFPTKQEQSSFPLPELSPLQMESRQNYLNAKQEVLKSNLPDQYDNFALDVEIAKYLKSKSWSTSDITGTLTQSDYAYNLFQQNPHDNYSHRIAKYIYSVGQKTDLTFENHHEKVYQQRKSEPEIEY